MSARPENLKSTEWLTIDPPDARGSLPSAATQPQRRLAGKRVGMVVFSAYPFDPRPRRAIDALLDEGMHVDLICEGEDHVPERETKGRLRIRRIPIRHRRGGFSSYAYQYAAFIAYSAAILARGTLRARYDLIYVHNMPDILVISALFPKLLGAKVILDQHDPMPELMTTIFGLAESSFAVRVIRLLERWSMARANLVITVNLACKQIFSARSCPASKVAVVMNTPDLSIFPYRAASSYSWRKPGEPFRIMYHGSLVERNGLDLAVQALAKVGPSAGPIELRVYGRTTPYLEKVMALVDQLGLGKQVSYRGPKTLEALVDEIQSCDVGIVPNQRNTFTDINTPTRLFEYLSLGKPVIAPRTAGIQDYFDAQSLLFFDSGNAEQLAERIEFAATHAEECALIAERGQQVYLAHTWHRERETLVDLVDKLINKPSRLPARR
jgi:glycosyltransferase involved in cell wall biosynthesis